MTTTNTLPFTELTKEDLGTREIARYNSKAAGEEVVKIELSKITIRENFNVRTEFGNLEELALSILENGQTIPGRVDVLADGTFVIVDGHRRFKACCLLADMGHEPLFKAIVNNTKTTEEQRILQMFTTQDNKQLSTNETAELLSRLINLGYDQAGVAKKIGKTAAYVSQMLSYAKESPIIKEEVRKGNIKVSTVIKLQKQIPLQSERVKAVQKAVETKTATKTTKAVTANKVTGKDHKQEKAEEMANAIFDMFKEELPQGQYMALSNLIKSYL